MEIILLRHGETMDNNLKIYSRSETGLSFDGKIQIKNVREKILKMDFKKVYYSPLKRSKETLIQLGITGIAEPRISEIDFGIFEGKSYEQIVEEYPYESSMWFEDYIDYSIPEGESLRMVYHRVQEFLEELIKKDENVLLITHEGVIRLVSCWVLDNIDFFYRFKSNNAGISIISIVDGFKYISRLNSD